MHAPATSRSPSRDATSNPATPLLTLLGAALLVAVLGVLLIGEGIVESWGSWPVAYRGTAISVLFVVGVMVHVAHWSVRVR